MSKNKIIRSSIIIIIFTILTKVLGFFREAFVASKFGATYDTDIYTFAMGLIFLLFTSIGGGIGTTFIPLLSEYIEKKDYEERNSFVNNILNITGIFSIMLTVLSYIFAASLVYYFAPGFRDNQAVFVKMVSVTRIIEISMIFIGFQSILSAVLQSHSKFGIPAAMSVFSNLVILVYLAFFARYYGIWGLSVVTVVGYFIQLVIHIPTYRALGYKYSLKVNLKDDGFKIMLKLMLPIIIGTSFAQVSLLVDRLLATTTGEGSLAVLNFAYKLNTFVYGIFAVAITTVVYPNLSQNSAKDNIDGYIKSLVKAVNMIILIMIPATVGMDILRNPIITVLFKRGQFTESAAQLTASVLLFYSPSMIVFGIRDVLNMAFYSIKNTRTPMLNGLAGVIVNIVVNLLLVKHMGVTGLAFATSIAAVTTTMLLLLNLGKKVGHGLLGKIFKSAVKVCISSAVMGAVVYGVNKFCLLTFGEGMKGSVISIALSAAVGVVVFVTALFVLKVDEFEDVKQIVGSKLKKLKRTEVIGVSEKKSDLKCIRSYRRNGVSMAEKKKGYVEIYIMLAIGIVLIVIANAFPPVLEEHSMANYLKLFINNFNLPLYFILSGFMFYKFAKINSAGAFIKEKFKLLMIPYLVYSATAYLLINVLMTSSSKLRDILNSHGYFYKNISNALYEIVTFQNHIVNYLWLVYTLFIIFIAALFVESLRRVNQKVILSILFIISFISYSQFFAHTKYDLIRSVMNYMFFFYIGKLFAERYEYRKRIVKRRKLIFTLFAAVNALLIFLFIMPVKNEYTVYLSTVLLYFCGILGTLSVYNIAVWLKRYGFDKALKSISNYYHDIYLLHQPIIVSGSVLLLYKVMRLPVLVSVAVSSILGIVLPMLLSRHIIRKNGLLRLLFVGGNLDAAGKDKNETAKKSFYQNLKGELNQNHGMRVKLSLMTFRIGFLSEYMTDKKIIKVFLSIIYKVMWILCCILNCGEIPPKEVFIDWGLRIPHGFMGVAINRSVKIGKNCTLYHNVTVGAIEGEEYSAETVIGDNVYIGTASIILGNVRIGHNSKVGAGTMVINKYIPDNTTVVNEIKYREFRKISKGA